MKKSSLAALSLIVILCSGSVLAQRYPGPPHGAGGVGNNGRPDAAPPNPAVLHGRENPDDAPKLNDPAQSPKVNDVLTKNQEIADRISALTGAASAIDACTGFKNVGQCVAAAHVAKNIDGGNFYCLRQAMTGTPAPAGNTCTTTGNMSLGKAVRALYPQANSSAESKKGETEARQDLKSSGAKS